MKRKLLATLAICAALTMTAGIFPACTEDDTDNGANNNTNGVA